MKDEEKKQVAIFLGTTAIIAIILFFIANITGEIKLKENPARKAARAQSLSK